MINTAAPASLDVSALFDTQGDLVENGFHLTPFTLGEKLRLVGALGLFGVMAARAVVFMVRTKLSGDVFYDG